MKAVCRAQPFIMMHTAVSQISAFDNMKTETIYGIYTRMLRAPKTKDKIHQICPINKLWGLNGRLSFRWMVAINCEKLRRKIFVNATVNLRAIAYTKWFDPIHCGSHQRWAVNTRMRTDFLFEMPSTRFGHEHVDKIFAQHPKCTQKNTIFSVVWTARRAHMPCIDHK